MKNFKNIKTTVALSALFVVGGQLNGAAAPHAVAIANPYHGMVQCATVYSSGTPINTVYNTSPAMFRTLEETNACLADVIAELEAYLTDATADLIVELKEKINQPLSPYLLSSNSANTNLALAQEALYWLKGMPADEWNEKYTMVNTHPYILKLAFYGQEHSSYDLYYKAYLWNGAETARMHTNDFYKFVRLASLSGYVHTKNAKLTDADAVVCNARRAQAQNSNDSWFEALFGPSFMDWMTGTKKTIKGDDRAIAAEKYALNEFAKDVEGQFEVLVRRYTDRAPQG